MDVNSVTLKAPKRSDAPVREGDLGENTSRSLRDLCLVVGGLFVAQVIMWLIHDAMPIGRVFYVSVLLFVCLTPMFLLRQMKYRLLTLFLVWYFAIFGMLDLINILFGPKGISLAFLEAYAKSNSVFTLSDIVIIVGAFCAIAGYLAALLMMRQEPRFLSNEWKPSLILAVALIIWVPSFAVSVGYYLTIHPSSIPSHILGIPFSYASNIRLFPMISAVMLIYLYIRGYNRPAIGLIIAIFVGLEMVLGFLANTKEVSYRILCFMLIASFFINGTINKKIIAVILLTFIPYSLFFTIYRLQVIQIREQTPLEAISQIGKTRDLVAGRADKESEKTDQSVAEQSLRGLADRVNARYYVEIIVSRAGKDVSFQNGSTLLYLIYSFIPRAIWAGKPPTSTGQLFNNEFSISESPLTFVPTTFIGEFYWNFGFPAVVVGMFLVGMSLGAIGRLQSSLRSLTLPRFVTLLLACYFLILKFEAGIGQQYGLFGRIFILVLLMHLAIAAVGQVYRRP